MTPLNVIVIGAGLGGLTAASCLSRAGFDVTIYEQAAALGEVGAGIQVGPNAIKVLRHIGIEDALEAVAVRPDGLDVRDWQTGRVINTITLGEAYARQYDAPYYHVHRADVHALLVHAFETAAPGRIRLGAKYVALQTGSSGVRVQFADGSTVAGDMVVGADGIHSAVREALFGPDHPRFTGMVAFRGIVPLAQLPAGMIERRGYNWTGPHHHFVHYLLKGGTMVNCVGVCEQDDWRIESWSVEGDLNEFQAEFAGWHDTIQALIGGMDRCFKWALYDRDPLPQWTRGRATLLGDACHPMLPFLAQGACMSIEDGYVLVHCLRAEGDVDTALETYESLRKPRVSQVQHGARERGKQLHLAAPDAIAERNARNTAEPERRARQMDWIYRHDVVETYGPLSSGTSHE